MTKKELVEKLAKKVHLTKKAAEEAVNGVFSEIGDSLKKGEKVVITGFGTFKVGTRATRRARNPQTGAPIQIPARKTPRFVAGKALKRAVR